MRTFTEIALEQNEVFGLLITNDTKNKVLKIVKQISDKIDSGLNAIYDFKKEVVKASKKASLDEKKVFEKVIKMIEETIKNGDHKQITIPALVKKSHTVVFPRRF